MDLERVPVRLDELPERPLVTGLGASQQATLIHLVAPVVCHLSPRQTAPGTQTHRTTQLSARTLAIARLI
jgi:hypothetical protein